MVDDRIREPKKLTGLLDARRKAEEKMPLDQFVKLVKAGKETENQQAVSLLRAARALSSRIDSDLHNTKTIAQLDSLLPRLEAALGFPTEEGRGRALLYAIINSRDLRDADTLTSTRFWGGPFTQIFGQKDRNTGRNMWSSFFDRNPDVRARITDQLQQEFPDDADYVKECVSSPSHGNYMESARNAHERQVWGRFLELTLRQLRTAIS